MYPSNNTTNGGYSTSSRQEYFYERESPRYTRKDPPRAKPQISFQYQQREQPQQYYQAPTKYSDYTEGRRSVAGIEGSRYFETRERQQHPGYVDRERPHAIPERPVSTRLSYHPVPKYAHQDSNHYESRRTVEKHYSGPLANYPSSRASSRNINMQYQDRIDGYSRHRASQYDSVRVSPFIGSNHAGSQRPYISEYSTMQENGYQRSTYESNPGDFEERLDHRTRIRPDPQIQNPMLRQTRSQLHMTTKAAPIREEVSVEARSTSPQNTVAESNRPKQLLPGEIRSQQKAMEALLSATAKVKLDGNNYRSELPNQIENLRQLSDVTKDLADLVFNQNSIENDSLDIVREKVDRQLQLLSLLQ